MTENLQQTLSRAILTLLRPLVRILIRNGIAYGSFAELAKKIYVDVAFEDFAPEGKKQTISRVSALTGLTRKETRRLYELDDTDARSSEQRYNRAVRVISGWVNDPRFQDSKGEPATLPIESDGHSFAELVKEYSGDMTTQTMLAVLTTAGSVEKTDDHLALVRRAYLPGNDPAEKLTILGKDSAELIATIDHNLTADKDQLHFQRKVSSYRVQPEAVESFRTMAAEKSQLLLEEFDAWLLEHEVSDEASDAGHYVSVGIYYYEPDSHREKPQ
ncbi:hypothetical protein DFR30_0176 [Thiogranum longum]|uniref:Uncharacterized protein n=1 Tax=Thiogranum longum TaxID=1537524 RepID=A0A4R1H5G6_9GAMM|nr:DUF6502 family protein [Thiogranum longum]TCK16957.1 hypothetical protein DFR30_0176 [Thiogranum longum]